MPYFCEYKKYDTYLNTVDTNILVEEFDLRLRYDKVNTKMTKKITSMVYYKMMMKYYHKNMDGMSLIEENKLKKVDVNNSNNENNNNNKSNGNSHNSNNSNSSINGNKIIR